MNLVEKAEVFATAAHAAVKHTRKYTHEPYIVHPAHVVDLVKQFAHTDEMLAAAWLHDVVEDTGVELEEIRNQFGDAVANLVDDLTKVSKLEDGNREVRKELDRQRLAVASADAQTIKCCDIVSNMHSIVEHDKQFAQLFLNETILLLQVLTEADSRAIEMLEENLDAAIAEIDLIVGD